MSGTRSASTKAPATDLRAPGASLVVCSYGSGDNALQERLRSLGDRSGFRETAAATLFGTLFRPIAFGASVLSLGNVATIPTALVCVILASTRDRRVHSVLVPIIFLTILFDTVLVTGVQG